MSGFGGSAEPAVIPVPGSGSPLVIRNDSGTDVVVERTAAPSFSVTVPASATATIPFPSDASPSDYDVAVRPADPSATPSSAGFTPAGLTLSVPSPSPVSCASGSPIASASDSAAVPAVMASSTPAATTTPTAAPAVVAATTVAPVTEAITVATTPHHAAASTVSASNPPSPAPATAKPTSVPPAGPGALALGPETAADQGGGYVLAVGLDPDERAAAAPMTPVPAPAVAPAAAAGRQVMPGGYTGGDLARLSAGSPLPGDGRVLAAATGSSTTRAQHRAFGLPVMLGLVLVAGVASAVGRVRGWRRRFG